MALYRRLMALVECYNRIYKLEQHNAVQDEEIKTSTIRIDSLEQLHKRD